MKKKIKLFLIPLVFFLIILVALGGNIRHPFGLQPKIAAPGDVWFGTVTDKEVGDIFETDIYVDTGNQKIAAYGIDITYNQNVIVVETSIGTSGVEAGADGFVTAVDANTPGVITILGFDVVGTGPGSQLHLLRIWWEAIALGTSPLDISIDALVDENNIDIGTPTGIDGSVEVVEDVTIGNVWFGTVTDKEVGNIFETALYVDTGIQLLAWYSIYIAYNQNVIIVDTSVGNNGVEVGADGFVTDVNVDTPGVIEIWGIDPVGRGPGSQLHLLNITWIAVAVGTSPLDIIIDTLVDIYGYVIGTPTDIDGSVVVVEDVTIGDVWIGSVPTKDVGAIFETQIYVNTGSQKIAAYGIDIAYNQNVIVVDTSVGNNGVEAGADGFVSAVDVNTPGVIIISGFDLAGTGPGSQLHLLNITWIAVAVGTSFLDITVDALLDPDTNVIGTPTGIDGSVVVEDLTIGDVWVGSVPTKDVGDIFETQIYVDTGTQEIATYGIDIGYNQNVIVVDTSVGNNGIEAGADGFVSTVDVNTPGMISISGFDATRTGPGSQLHLLNITWIAVAVGTSPLDITVDALMDPDTNVIGNPTGIDGSIYITEHIAPLITINVPSNNTYHSKPPTIQVIIYDLSEINTTWYTVPGCGESKTFSGSSIDFDVNLWNDQEEGLVLIRIFANDSIGNLGQTDLIIIKDAFKPSIRVTSPLDGDVFGEDAPEFNITVSDLHLDILYYTINDSAIKYFVSFTSGTNLIAINESVWDALPEGQVLIRFFINDTAGNINDVGVVLKKQIPSRAPAIPGYNIFIFLFIGTTAIIILFFRKRK